MIGPQVRKRGGLNRSSDIIVAILNSDRMALRRALSESSNNINSIHSPTGMNAVMLAVMGRLSAFVRDMGAHAGELDFSHVDDQGRDLMTVALASLDVSSVDAVQDIYERHAPHLLNNWPSPEV